MTSSSRADRDPGRVAGIDFGTVRVGIALSDPQRRFAGPHETYTRGGEAADAAYFQRLAQQEAVTLFVVGLPIHCSGEESQKSYEARQFGHWLAEATDVPVVFFDERFSSHQADQWLAEAKMTRKKRKSRRDMLAAQSFLAAFLESGCRATDRPEGLEG